MSPLLHPLSPGAGQDGIGSCQVAEVELYWFPGTCARVPYVALEEIGEPFELVVVNLFRDREAYKSVNAKGKVPALRVNGRLLTENPAIQTFLTKAYPEVRLLPTGDAELEIDALSTISWFAAGVHPAITRLRFPRFASEEPQSWDGIRASARAQLEEAFALLERRLDGREWLYGEWSLVDAYMLWLWFRATGSGMDGLAFPRCADHARRCEQRPSVASVLDREEEELAELRAAGALPADLPPFQAGRAPVF